MLSDFVAAIRAQRQSPAVALTAILTIALGVGASTAIFSVANAVLLRPLPYEDPDSLVVVSAEMRRRNAASLPLSGPDFLDLRRGATRMFEDFAAVQTGHRLLRRADGTLEQIRFASVSPNFFQLLGGQIALGRDFTERDGQLLSEDDAGALDARFFDRSSTVAVLSYGYWQRRYGGSAAVLGQPLSGRTAGGPQIVGILGPGLELLFPSALNVERSPDVWFAARLSYDETERKIFSHRVIGRLKEGVRLERAQVEVDGVAAELRAGFPLWQTSDLHIEVEPLGESLTAQAQPALVALMGAAIFLLLIACANVANLLLVRTSVRERELAIRTALGGSRWCLVRQTLAEALLLAAMATFLGAGLAWTAVRTLLAIAPANLPRLEEVGIDAVVLTFTALLGLVATALVGIAPALRASRPDVISVLRASGRLAGTGRGRLLRSSVVLVQIALSFVLLIGCGLMLRSFVALKQVDPGFESNGLLTFKLLASPYETPQPREALMQDVRARLEAMPGVQSVTAASPFPLADPFGPIRWGTEDALIDASRFQAVDHQIVLPGYFRTLRTQLLAGRSFSPADNSPDRNVVIVDQLLAAKAFPGESAVGKRLLVRIRTPEPEWVEVIGVAAHQRGSGLAELGREQIYFTDGFMGYGAATRWAIRTAGDPAAYEGVVRGELAKLGGELVMSDMESMDALVQRAQAETRFSLLLIGSLASVAIILAAVGLYGVLSTLVRQRTAEIGVRMAVGAAPRSIFALVFGQGFRLAIAGIVIGLVAAFYLTRMMTSMLVGIEATDPAAFTATTLLFFLITGAASWLPARRAAHLDPVAALRKE